MNLIEIIIMIFFGIYVFCFILAGYYTYKKSKSYDKLGNIFVDFSNNIKKEIEKYYKEEQKK